MKKILLTTAVLVFAFSNINAQLGIRLGGNLANIYNDQNVSTKNIFGLNGGITNNFGSKNLQFKTGLLFSQKGYQFDLGSSNTAKVSINYIDVPLNLSYTIFKKFQVEAGLFLGVGLTAKQTLNSNSSEIEFDDNGLNRLDGGFNTGINYGITKNIFVGLNYNLGLIDIANGTGSVINNRYSSLNLTYILNPKD